MCIPQAQCARCNIHGDYSKHIGAQLFLRICLELDLLLQHAPYTRGLPVHHHVESLQRVASASRKGVLRNTCYKCII